MRTLSVREVANALGLTKRAVMYRLENGKLKGTRIANSYGQDEWRVYPNKEIMQAVQAKGIEADTKSELSFDPEGLDSIEAEAVTVQGLQEDYSEDWRAREMERLEIITEKLMKPLADKLEAQAFALAEKDRIIEDQGRRLRLLPDLQKQAEDRAKEAESKHVEAEALKKQIAAMQEQVEASKRSWWKKLIGTP